MNHYLLWAGILSALLGWGHSWLGERLVLVPLFHKGGLPPLLGSEAFLRRTLRFAWHVTTILMMGLGAVLILSARPDKPPLSGEYLEAYAICFGAAGAITLLISRGRHFAWLVFGAIAGLIWLGR